MRLFLSAERKGVFAKGLLVERGNVGADADADICTWFREGDLLTPSMLCVDGPAPALAGSLCTSSVSALTFTGGGAFGSTSKRLGSCFAHAWRFSFATPSTMLMRLGTSVSRVRPDRWGDDTEFPRLCPFAGGGGLGLDAGSLISIDAVRLCAGGVVCCWLEDADADVGERISGWVGVEAADCLDREELRERDVWPLRELGSVILEDLVLVDAADEFLVAFDTSAFLVAALMVSTD